MTETRWRASSLQDTGGHSAALFAPLPAIAKIVEITNKGRTLVAFRLRVFIGFILPDTAFFENFFGNRVDEGESKLSVLIRETVCCELWRECRERRKGAAREIVEAALGGRPSHQQLNHPNHPARSNGGDHGVPPLPFATEGAQVEGSYKCPDFSSLCNCSRRLRLSFSSVPS